MIRQLAITTSSRSSMIRPSKESAEQVVATKAVVVLLARGLKLATAAADADWCRPMMVIRCSR